MTTKNQSLFPKEIIDAAIAHSIEMKNHTIKPVEKSPVIRPSKTPPYSSVVSGMSQTTPKVGNDFKKVFSKVIGAKDLPETRSADYSETYQRAFGGGKGEKIISTKQAKKSIIKPTVKAKPPKKPNQQENTRNEGFSAGYATVFGRLKKDEDAEKNTKIRESLKKCVQVTEKEAPEKSFSPNKSVFEKLSNSRKDGDPNSRKTTSEGEDPSIKLVGTSPKHGKSVFERFSNSGSE